MRMPPLPKKQNIKSITYGSFRGMYCTQYFSDDNISNIIEMLDQNIENGKIIKDGKATTLIVATIDKNLTLIKRYNFQGIWHTITHRLVQSRARRVFYNTLFLEKIGIATPKVLAYLEKRKNGFVTESYLLSEYIPCKNYGDLLREEALDEEQKRYVLSQVEKMLQIFNKHKIYHGDIKHANILVNGSDVLIIDFDAMKRFRSKLFFNSRHKKDMKKFKTRLSNWPLVQDK